MIKLLKEGVGIVVCEKCEWVQVLRGGRFHEGGGVLHYRARDIRRTVDPIRSRTQEPDLVLLAIQGCQMAKFDPFLSLDCARVEGVGAQSKERKGSNFAA